MSRQWYHLLRFSDQNVFFTSSTNQCNRYLKDLNTLAFLKMSCIVCSYNVQAKHNYLLAFIVLLNIGSSI